jgi:hypothetical protein
MEFIRLTDEQHIKAVSALQNYLNTLVTLTLERVQELKKDEKMLDEYEDWSANWLLKNSDARGFESIESLCGFMAATRDANEGDEIFEAAHWAVLTAEAAEKAVSWFEEKRVYDMLWWLSNAIFKYECVKGLSDYETREKYFVKKEEVLSLLRDHGYEVTF